MLLLPVATLLGLGYQAPAEYAYSIPHLSGVTIPGLPPVDGHICVDQFGYLPDSQKVAVISHPNRGFNQNDPYLGGIFLQVRRRDGKSVLRGKAMPWNNGKIHEDSGDQGWWFDFSKVQTPGQYYLFDERRKARSPLFRIGTQAFNGALKASTRMFFYQRIGVPLERKFTKGPWTDGPSYLQDAHARYVLAKTDPKQERDLSGGWMDAGDTDKYPPFNGDVIHPLLYAYTANPKVFTDDFGIPESGNGLPDILDEVKVQLDCLLRMQFPDGSVPIKMGNIDYNGTQPLSKDKRTRYYGPKDTGATIYTCANFAHAARVYGKFPAWRGYAAVLKARALKAWEWYLSHPKTTNLDTGEIKSGIANRSPAEQDRMSAYAAIHLFALTQDPTFQNAIRANYGKSRNMSEYLWSPYEAGASESLVDYLTVPHADPMICSAIRLQLARSAKSDHFAPPASADLYRAWMEPSNYHWGSNFVRSSWGVVAMFAAKSAGLDGPTRERLRERAMDMLHSFHGVNPFGIVYLSNMGSYGAEYSIKQMYHERYGFGTPYSKNPPPGYVVGGPNQSFTGKAAAGKPSLDWIRQQPRAKAYADYNLAWPESSWELSEPAIYYQAMYVRLAAEFAH